MDWDYSGDVTVTAASGCADVAQSHPHGIDMVDLSVDVTGHFNGRIEAHSGPQTWPHPVVFGAIYTTDVPEDVYAQTGDLGGLPAWVQVFRNGQRFTMLEDCAIPLCGGSGGVCGAAQPQARNITQNSFQGSIYLAWDGMDRREDPQLQCWTAQPAPAGDYTARFCVGSSVQDGVVGNTFCQEVPFTLPATEVTARFDFGG